MKTRFWQKVAGPVVVLGCCCSLIWRMPRSPCRWGPVSYASSIPAADQFVGGFYSMTAQQVVNLFTNLHLAATITNRPVPSNKWWTDILVADRSYQPSGGGARVIQQDPFGGQLWHIL